MTSHAAHGGALSYEMLAARRRMDAAHPARTRDEDTLLSARGILTGALMGGGLWLATLYALWLIVR